MIAIANHYSDVRQWSSIAMDPTPYFDQSMLGIRSREYNIYVLNDGVDFQLPMSWSESRDRDVAFLPCQFLTADFGIDIAVGIGIKKIGISSWGLKERLYHHGCLIKNF